MTLRISSKIILFLSAALLLGASLAFGSVDYTIKKGDTLAKVAKKHGVSVSELQRANSHINSRHMKPGLKVVIPSKAHAAAARKKSGENRTASRPEKAEKLPEVPAPAEEKEEKKTEATYHTVRKGDTVSSISRAYGISAADLKDLNHIRKNRLRAGQKLLVKRIGPRTYTVKKGDNIWRIAQKFDMEADDLMTLNEMDSPALKAGQVLYLEQTVDTASGEKYKEAVGRNIEEEIKTLAESEEFKEQDSQNKLVTFAKKMLNIPYRFGGNSILGIDCSAYVKKAYGFLGVELPRTAREQFKEGEKVDRDELSIGDLVFFRTYASFPSHVGIYLGNNLFIHASSKGKRVTIDSLDTPYYLKRFIGGKRVITEEEEKDPGQQQG